MSQTSDKNIVTVINTFTVDPGNQQPLVDLLIRATDGLVSRASGFISSTLHRNVDGTKVAMYAHGAASRTIRPCGLQGGAGSQGLRLALAAADAALVPLPVGSAVRDSLIDAVAHQEGEMDLAVLGQVAARRAGR